MTKKTIGKGVVEKEYTRKDVRFYMSGEGDIKTTTATITVGGRNYSVTDYNAMWGRGIRSHLVAELEQMAGIEIKTK